MSGLPDRRLLIDESDDIVHGGRKYVVGCAVVLAGNTQAGGARLRDVLAANPDRTRPFHWQSLSAQAGYHQADIPILTGSSLCRSDVDQWKSTASGGGELLHVGAVRSDDGTAAADTCFGHRRVDRTDRVGQRPPECTGPLRLIGR